METVIITKKQMLDLFNNVNKGTFIGMDFETIPKMNKKGNPYYGMVTKSTTGLFLIGNSYEDRVNNNAAKEELPQNFKAQSARQGNHMSKIILYNEKLNRYYIQLEVIPGNKNKYSYLFNGKKIDYSDIEPFVPKKSTNTTQPQNKLVNFISVNIDNIKKFRMNGKEFQIL